MESSADSLDHLFPAEDTALPAGGRRSRKNRAKPKVENPAEMKIRPRSEEDEDEDNDIRGKGKEVFKDGRAPPRGSTQKPQDSASKTGHAVPGEEDQSESDPRGGSPAGTRSRSARPTSTQVDSHSFREYKDDAEEATQQILGDVLECNKTLRMHGANADELRHTVESWMSQVLKEFIGKKEEIRLYLQEKWLNKELTCQAPDMGLRQKNLLESIRRLEDWRKVSLQEGEQALSKLCKQSTIPLKELQKAIGEFLDKLTIVLEDIKSVRDYKVNPGADQKPTIEAKGQEDCSSSSSSQGLDGTAKKQAKHGVDQISLFLSKLKELNSKSVFTIVVVALESAGKSTFINAILGFDLLPSSEGRCTMVPTVVEPSTANELECVVDFRPLSEFDRTLDSLPKKEGETNSELEERKARIRRACAGYVGRPSEKRIANSKDEQRRTIDEIREYLTSEERMYAVRLVTIGTSKLGQSNVPWRMVDTPGWDSVIAEHRVITMQAISTADAFIVLSDGNRPDINAPQEQFLSKIKKLHYDAMSKAFGVLTHLDTIDDVEVYQRVLAKAKQQLMSYGFLQRNIFPACPIAAFDDPPERVRGIVKNIQSKLDEYPGLAEGFDDCLTAITQCVTRDLPIRRAREAADMARKHILPHVADALQAGRKIIPDYIIEEQIDDVVTATNIQNWGQMYERLRFLPALQAANRWKNQEVIAQSLKLAEYITRAYGDLLDEEERRTEITHKDLTEAMLTQDAIHQVNHWVIEDQERARLVEHYLGIVERVSFALAERLFSEYVEQLVALLNSTVCPEEPYVFATTLQLQQCQWELKGQLRRVASPIIQAALRWAHLNTRSRKGAAEEMMYVLPWVASKMATSEEDNDEVPILSALLREHAPTVLQALGVPFAAQVAAVADKVVKSL